MKTIPSQNRSTRSAHRWQNQRSGGRFGLKQFSLIMGVVILAVIIVSALAMLASPGKQRSGEILLDNSQSEQLSPTPIGPGLGD
jgi:uncharacterized membrane protein